MNQTQPDHPKGTLETPALVSRFRELAEESRARPPVGESAETWRAREMIDILYQLGTITVSSVVQLQGIAHRLAERQERILQAMEALGADVGTLKQDTIDIKDDTEWLKDWQAEALDKLDILETSVNDLYGMVDSHQYE